MDPSPARVAHMYMTGASTMYWEIEKMLQGDGWFQSRKPERNKRAKTFQKRFGGIWVKAIVTSEIYSRWVHILAPVPKGITILDGDVWSEAYDKVSRRLDYDKFTTSKVEALAKEVVANHKKMKPKRKNQDYAEFEWGGHTGKEGFSLWLARVEEIISKELKSNYESWDNYREYQPTSVPGLSTRSLVLNILMNYGEDPYGLSRKAKAKAIRAVLDRMVKKGILLKDPNGRELLWEWKP